MSRSVITIAILCLCLNTTGQNLNLRINELLTRNSTIQMDDFFEYDDWLEIYNPPGSPITNLAGYYLSDQADSLDKWLIPDDDAGVTTVLPNNFIVFWIDDDYDNTNSQGPTHTTGFTMSSDGETIYLTAPDAVTIIDSVSYPPMATDVSWGRTCDGCPDWQYFNNVTFEDNNIEIQNNDILFINEVQTQNITTYDDLEHEYDPWFEIYNPNDHQVNVGNYYLSINGTPTEWQIPATNPIRTVIPPNGHLLIWCDNDINDDVNHAPLNLIEGGGTITITGPDATTPIDSYTYPVIPEDQSYGRQSDGASSSIFFTIPTPTVMNELTIVQPVNLLINEVLAANTTDSTDNFDEHEDWFEIYNPNNFDVNLGGYYISDDPEVPNRWIVPTTFADSVTVPALGWLLFWADDDEVQGVRHTNFRLNNGGEYLGLFSPDGFTPADEIEWQRMGTDTSYGRLTDGGQPWVLFVETTPEFSNNGATINVTETSIEGLNIYPNPANLHLNFSELTSVNVYSISGTLLESHQQTRQIVVSEWPSGVYILRDQNGRTARVIKQ